MEKTKRWKIAQKLELKWWERYLSSKDKGEYLAWKRNYWLELLKTVEPELSLEKGQSVLDAGCGPAGMFIALPKQKVTAIDPLLDSYASNIDHFEKSDYPGVDFQSIGLEEYRTAEKFDLVCCLNVINHVRNIDLAMDNLWDAVKPGAYFLLSIDGHNYSGFKKLFRALPGDLLHPQQYDLAEYEKLVTDRGGEILKTVLLKEEFFFNHYLVLGRK